jgi:hypothetical protein
MSILGKVLKGTITVLADGMDFVIIKSSKALVNKYGENQVVQTAAEIGSRTVLASEGTLKTLTEVVDGGLTAGAGYLADNEVKRQAGLSQIKTAGREILVGAKDGLISTYEAGSNTAASAARAGKYYVRGKRNLAREELVRTKLHGRNFGKLVVVALLAFGPTQPSDKNNGNLKSNGPQTFKVERNVPIGHTSRQNQPIRSEEMQNEQ